MHLAPNLSQTLGDRTDEAEQALGKCPENDGDDDDGNDDDDGDDDDGNDVEDGDDDDGEDDGPSNDLYLG